MCGIVACLTKDRDKPTLSIGIDALTRLEYRGYDSAGAAFRTASNTIICKKAIGKILNLQKELEEYDQTALTPLILHTRWATHGTVTTSNAHPLSDCSGNFYIAHNGIVENYTSLKKQLQEEGHVFLSETDTEVIAHLIEKYFINNLEDAVRKALEQVVGTYGIAVISTYEPDKIVAASLSSPLLIGLGEDIIFVASDLSAIAPYIQKVVYLDDREVAVIEPNGYTIIREKKPQEVQWSGSAHDKGNYPHYMLQEIMEQPSTLEETMRGRLDLQEGSAKLGGLISVAVRLSRVNNVQLVGCGTAYHACLFGEYLLEEHACISSKSEVSSEFRYRKRALSKDTALIAVSQSGETADTLAAIKDAVSNNILALGITNSIGSTQTRITDAGVYTRSGTEIGVAATKTFTSQLVSLVLLALLLGRQRKLTLPEGQTIVNELLRIPNLVRHTLLCTDRVLEIAKKYENCENFFFLGRKYNYPIAKEGALKLKEISYVHAEGSYGGELKHGELALVSEHFPSICIVPKDSVYDKMVSNIEEIKTRNGTVIAITTEGNTELKSIADDVIYIPETLEILYPILSIIPLQLFAYHFANLRGCDIDKPRNLAKSVTVE